MFDATDAAARRSWVTSPYRSVEGNCFVARSEEHTSELQSLAYLVCRLIISEEHTSELQSLAYLVCRLLLEKKNTDDIYPHVCFPLHVHCYMIDLRHRHCRYSHTAYRLEHAD